MISMFLHVFLPLLLYFSPFQSNKCFWIFIIHNTVYYILRVCPKKKEGKARGKSRKEKRKIVCYHKDHSHTEDATMYSLSNRKHKTFTCTIKEE